MNGQTRLHGAVDEHADLRGPDDDPDVEPTVPVGSGFDRLLELAGPLLPQAAPGPVRVGDVLNRAGSPAGVLRPEIEGTEIDRIVGLGVPNPEGDSHEAPLDRRAAALDIALDLARCEDDAVEPGQAIPRPGVEFRHRPAVPVGHRHRPVEDRPSCPARYRCQVRRDHGLRRRGRDDKEGDHSALRQDQRTIAHRFAS
ncbi:MAG: hypothetical protein MZU91_11040 [Desulfosudis oleivorans]|nr:hypothetical protein [Desulfosudis oleivorans]